MNAIVAIHQMKYRSEQLLLYTLIAAVSVLCGLYFYFLSASVIHVVISKEVEEMTHKLNSEIASLEATYMEKQHSMSIEVVERHGYVASGKKIFLDRSETSLVTRR